MVLSQIIKIDGIDVSSYRFNTVNEDSIEDQADKMIISVSKDLDNLETLTLQTFKSVEIFEAYSGTVEQDSNRVFKGVVAKIVREPNKIKIIIFSNLWQAVNSEVNKTYDRNIDPSAGKGSEIFKNLCDLANLSYDSSTIIDTGTIILLDKFVCNKANIFERMKTLGEIYGYQIWYSSQEDKVHFEPTGYSLNSNVITVGGTTSNVSKVPTWKEDATKLFNKIEVIGAFQEIETTESFNGTGSQDDFVIINEPQIVNVVVDGTEQTGGVEGSTAVFDYTVDKDQKTISFEAASTPGSGTNNVVIKYSYRAPRPVVKRNETSIADIGQTIKQVFTFHDIKKVDDAETRADNLLNVYSSPFITTTLLITPTTREAISLAVGQVIRVVDERNNIDRQMLVKRIRSTYPASTLEVDVGDKDVRVGDLEFDTTIRLKRLEEELSASGTFIVEIIDLNNDVNISNRYVILEKRDILTGVLYWDNTTQGNWDEFDWDDGADNTFVTYLISQGGDLYEEFFEDEDFKNAVTTGDWNTTTQQLNL